MFTYLTTISGLGVWKNMGNWRATNMTMWIQHRLTSMMGKSPCPIGESSTLMGPLHLPYHCVKAEKLQMRGCDIPHLMASIWCYQTCWGNPFDYRRVNPIPSACSYLNNRDELKPAIFLSNSAYNISLYIKIHPYQLSIHHHPIIIAY